MLNFIKNFRNDEDGAVTVDWVVLTAAIVALGLAVGSSVATNTKVVSSGTAAAILTADD
jgi:Flp pilus assembly pilin Flp